MTCSNLTTYLAPYTTSCITGQPKTVAPIFKPLEERLKLKKIQTKKAQDVLDELSIILQQGSTFKNVTCGITFGACMGMSLLSTWPLVLGGVYTPVGITALITSLLSGLPSGMISGDFELNNLAEYTTYVKIFSSRFEYFVAEPSELGITPLLIDLDNLIKRLAVFTMQPSDTTSLILLMHALVHTLDQKKPDSDLARSWTKLLESTGCDNFDDMNNAFWAPTGVTAPKFEDFRRFKKLEEKLIHLPNKITNYVVELVSKKCEEQFLYKYNPMYFTTEESDYSLLSSVTK